MYSNKYHKELEKLLKRFSLDLSPNDISFFKRIFFKDQTVYLNRLKKIGFDKGERILDAGCGFGQWSLQMSEGFKETFAIDISMVRLEMLQNIVNILSKNNIILKQSGLEKLSFKGNFFSNIFCYGAIFLTPWKETLKEFYRVLKSGGSVYFSANGIGWYVHLWQNQPNAAYDYDPRDYVANTFYNTHQYSKSGMKPFDKGDIIMEHESVYDFMKELGFKNIKIGSEGELGSSEIKRISLFQDEYYNLPGAFEVMAEK